MSTLVNECAATARFPDPWKHAIVVPILKSADKDIRIPKSYRPVSLLPVLGKIVEKVINTRMQEQVQPNLTGKQYGFTPGRSTQDAIRNLLTWSQAREEKYVLSIFLDITGAFDNLKWSALQEDLENIGVSLHVRAWLTDYLQGRTASLTIGGITKKVNVTKGCPQGSILGPALWNVTMEALLRTDYPQFVSIQAYADDIALSVAASTRAMLVSRAEQALIPVLDWAYSRGLCFSAQKSAAMLTKGTLAPGFTVKFGEERIVVVSEVKYLGITLDDKHSFSKHIEGLAKAAEGLFTRLRGTMGPGWGIRRENLMLMYKGVFLPKVSYGINFWAHAVSTRENRKELHKLQRTVLLGITSAYITTSTDALQVLAGVLPLDLELRLRATMEDVKLLPVALQRNTLDAARDNL